MKPASASLLRALTALPLLFSSFLFAQAPTISYQSVITGLSAPLDIVNAKDGTNRLFIVQQGGIIKVWNGTTASDFMNLGPSGANVISTGGERGLLSMAFHPGFNGTTNRYFFVYYTDLNGDVTVSRYQTVSGNSNLGDAATGQVILVIPHPGQSNHNGGKLNFGADGNLYFATGDGGGGNDVPNNAQNKASLLGKMIRINVDNFAVAPFYTVPATNPYIDSAGYDPRIYNYGLRNPFRWSFDRLNGNMWIGDVGQDAKEEIDFRPADSTGHNNFGWHCYEGTIHTPGVTVCSPDPPYDYRAPISEYDNPNPGSSAVTGGFVYRGSEYPIFRGYYIAADVYSGTVYLIHRNGSAWVTESQAGLTTFIVGFGEAENGTLYAVSQGTNTVYKVVAAGGTPLPVTLSAFTIQHSSNYNELRWTTASEQNTSRFYIEYGIDGRNFTRAGSVTARGSSTGSSYSFQHLITTQTTTYYRLAIEDIDGRTRYSSILKVVPDEAGIHIYPSVINNGLLQVSGTVTSGRIQMVNSNGAMVFEQAMKNSSGTSAIYLPTLPPGVYVVRVISGSTTTQAKVLLQ
jgi:glucose/arabinose dehydrogenase